MFTTESEKVPITWLAKLVEQRDRWLGRRSGRRIEETIAEVRLFERDALVVCIWVEGGKIEQAKADALTIAIERDRLEDRVA